MALLANIGARTTGPVRNFGILSPGTETSNFRNGGQLRNFPLHDGAPDGALKTGYPSGVRPPYSYSMAAKSGGLASFLEAQGSATATGSIADGRNLQGTSSGVATASGTAQLVVSASGTAAGVATVTGSVLAARVASGSSSGSATATATINALAWAVGTSSGAATASVVPYATGQLVGSIASAVTLEAASFSSHLLDAEDIETGLTLRQALRLVAAATAGKISGATGATITIRNPVADSKDRIVASVDGDGNRTSFAYDLS